MSCVQYELISNCNNACAFCLREDRIPLSKIEITNRINNIISNIYFLEDNFSGEGTQDLTDGISLLGGEIFYIKDQWYKDLMLKLVDVIIEKVLKKSPNPNCKLSFVTNGLYDPHELLFPICDKIKDQVGIKYIDANFSYDIKYRFNSENKRLKVLDTIAKYQNRYKSNPNIQMILTQYIIDATFKGKWSLKEFQQNDIKNCNFAFLYPHKISTGLKLDDFNFKREDFLKFLVYLKENFIIEYWNFILSTRNSAIFKYTGLCKNTGTDSFTQDAILTADKTSINPQCNHSNLYRCYSDSKECMLCDINVFEPRHNIKNIHGKYELII